MKIKIENTHHLVLIIKAQGLFHNQVDKKIINL